MSADTYSIDSINTLIQNASITKYELAQRIRVTPSHLYNVLNKKVPLSAKMAKKIIAELTPKKNNEAGKYELSLKRANIIIGLQRLADENEISLEELIDFLFTQCFPQPLAMREEVVIPKEVLDKYKVPR